MNTVHLLVRAVAGFASSSLRVLLRGPAFVLNALVITCMRGRSESRGAGRERQVIGLPNSGHLMILAPHPDDETLMAGATAAAMVKRGDPVSIALITDGEATRHDAETGGSPQALRLAEFTSATRALGVEHTRTLGFPDGKLSLERQRLAGCIGELLQVGLPHWVIAPFPYDQHPDHAAVAFALADALSVTGAPQTRVLCAPVLTPFNPEWPTRLVPARAEWRNKRCAVAAYRSRPSGTFSRSLQFARLHAAHALRPAEAFIEFEAQAYVRFIRAVEDGGLMMQPTVGRGHPLLATYELLRFRHERRRVSRLLLEAREWSALTDRPSTLCGLQ